MENQVQARQLSDARELLNMLEVLSVGFSTGTLGSSSVPWDGIKLTISEARDMIDQSITGTASTRSLQIETQRVDTSFSDAPRGPLWKTERPESPVQSPISEPVSESLPNPNVASSVSAASVSDEPASTDSLSNTDEPSDQNSGDKKTKKGYRIF